MKTDRILGASPATARIVGMALWGALLAGCGQKGPLYLPSEASPRATAHPAAPVTVTPSAPAALSATR